MPDSQSSDFISIELPKGKFERFIGKDGKNKRIFFSGKYGIGKTVFLKEFFKIHKENYDVYHLFPIRYQISGNENAIEILKYDILVELLKLYPDAFNTKKPSGMKGSVELFIAFCKDRGLVNRFLKSTLETSESILSLSPDPIFQTLAKLGRPLSDLLSLDKEFQEFKKEYGEKGIVLKFLKNIEAAGDTAATDYISYLVHEKILELKGSKKSVLILDDFDRMDPEHIFRILNVLSVHMDEDGGNKFGFDHIIIVGDIRNIRSIFHHRYGEKTEFQGYFDKFFSVSPFHFDNKQAIQESIPLLMQKIQCEEPNLKDALSDSGIISSFLEEVLSSAFETGQVNLRQIFKPIHNSFSELSKGTYSGNNAFVDGFNQLIDIAIKLFIAISGTEDGALETLIRIKNSGKRKKEMEWFFKEYGSSMLQYLVKLKVGESTRWLGKYDVQASQNPSHSARLNIYPINDMEANTEYFYDTLINYIEKGSYNKNSREYSY